METQKSMNCCVNIHFLKIVNLKNMIVTSDLNFNILDYQKNKKVQNFFNLMYRYDMIPTISKPTRDGKN